MTIPSECPNCGSMQVTVSNHAPSEHEYNGWTTHVECTECGLSAYQPELQ